MTVKKAVQYERSEAKLLTISLQWETMVSFAGVDRTSEAGAPEVLAADNRSDQVDDGEKNDKDDARHLEEDGMKGLHTQRTRICSREGQRRAHILRPFFASALRRWFEQMGLLTCVRCVGCNS